jgi:hypothetical protein
MKEEQWELKIADSGALQNQTAQPTDLKQYGAPKSNEYVATAACTGNQAG